MVSTFLLLVPMVPLAAFQAATGRPGSVLEPRGPAPGPASLPPPCTPGAPGCPDGGGPSSPFSPRAVREASRTWEWKNLETPGWKLLMADHVVLRGDVPVAELRRSGAYLEEFFRMLESALGGDTSGLMFSCRIFADPGDFRRYAARRGAANAESFYDPRTSELVVCLEGVRGDAWLQKTLAHEFTHAYMDRVWKRTEPLWFAEGMAEYFAGFTVKDGRARPGAVDRPALLLLRLQGTEPLRDFVKLGREEMYGPAFTSLYAQAWAFVHYLFSCGDDTVDLLLRGEPLKDVDKLEKAWSDYLEKLE